MWKMSRSLYASPASPELASVLAVMYEDIWYNGNAVASYWHIVMVDRTHH